MINRHACKLFMNGTHFTNAFDVFSPLNFYSPHRIKMLCATTRRDSRNFIMRSYTQLTTFDIYLNSYKVTHSSQRSA